MQMSGNYLRLTSENIAQARHGPGGAELASDEPPGLTVWVVWERLQQIVELHFAVQIVTFVDFHNTTARAFWLAAVDLPVSPTRKGMEVEIVFARICFHVFHQVYH